MWLMKIPECDSDVINACEGKAAFAGQCLFSIHALANDLTDITLPLSSPLPDISTSPFGGQLLLRQYPRYVESTILLLFYMALHDSARRFRPGLLYISEYQGEALSSLPSTFYIRTEIRPSRPEFE